MKVYENKFWLKKPVGELRKPVSKWKECCLCKEEFKSMTAVICTRCGDKKKYERTKLNKRKS